MPRFANGCGSGSISTQNPIYSWGQNTTPEAKEPPLHAGEYPSHKITHKHPSPRGERARYDDSTPARYSDSGASHPHGEAKQSAAGYNVRRDYGKIDPGAGRGNQQNRSSRGFGFGSSENARTRRNPRFENFGRVKPRGVTG
jgi:hypothetical protein